MPLLSSSKSLGTYTGGDSSFWVLLPLSIPRTFLASWPSCKTYSMLRSFHLVPHRVHFSCPQVPSLKIILAKYQHGVTGVLQAPCSPLLFTNNTQQKLFLSFISHNIFEILTYKIILVSFVHVNPVITGFPTTQIYSSNVWVNVYCTEKKVYSNLYFIRRN